LGSKPSRDVEFFDEEEEILVELFIAKPRVSDINGPPSPGPDPSIASDYGSPRTIRRSILGMSETNRSSLSLAIGRRRRCALDSTATGSIANDVFR
jgi:hypothetical protein